jgi:hypothetical protein
VDAYKYILSSELLLWWKKELCELQNEIDSGSSNLISVEIPVHDLTLATSQLVKAVQPSNTKNGYDSIYNRVCEPLMYDAELAGDFPNRLMDCIFAREHLLVSSLKILCQALQRRKERANTTAPFSLPEAQTHREEGWCVNRFASFFNPLITSKNSEDEHPEPLLPKKAMTVLEKLPPTHQNMRMVRMTNSSMFYIY